MLSDCEVKKYQGLSEKMNIVLKFRRRTQGEWCVAFAVFMPFTFGLLLDGLGLPTYIKYSIDVVWLFLLFSLLATRCQLPNLESQKLLFVVLLFWVTTLIGALFSFQNPLYYLWGFRNNFRFFVFFFACVFLLDRRNIEGYLKCFDVIFYLNFPVVLFQYFVQGYSQDYLGGIFGTHVGINDTTVVFFSIVLTKSILSFMNGREQLGICAIKCSMGLFISVLAELKVFFPLLLFIVCLSALHTKFSIRKVLIFVFCAITVFVGAKMLERLFTYWEDWFTLERMLSSLLSKNGYTDSGDMNRFTSIPMAWKMFLNTWHERLFGLGLGNCDSSSFSFLQTPFYARYNYLHYHWFSAAFIFMETGIIGLICYLSFFLQVYKQSGNMNRNNTDRRMECQFAQILAIVAIVLVVYHQSLRTEAGYMVYFIFSLPFIKNRKTAIISC